MVLRIGRFDECCPYCEKKIKNMGDVHSSHDYQTCFDMQCPHCEKEIFVNFHAIPEFEIFKKG